MLSKILSLNLSQRSVASIITLLALAGLYFGWREFWFLTDDAFIAFRYVSNSVLGHGYVWNAEPFRAVEGYTSFLHLLILEAVWRLFGTEPPESANLLSLIFASATVVLTTIGAMRMQLTRQLQNIRLYIVSLILLGLISNVTFLTWSSSGLETALFNCCFLAWILAVITIVKKGTWWRVAITATASLVYLARPDGMLILLGTLVLLLISLSNEFKKRQLKLSWFVSVLPMLVPLIHFIWRKSYYGEWLPNTYYAKHISAWPESGIRYLLSFLLESGIWLWVSVLLIVACKMTVSFIKSKKTDLRIAERFISVFQTPPDRRLCTIVAVMTVVLHLSYYTFVIGGDHFEWRVYSHLPPLLMLSFVYFMSLLNCSPGRTIISLALLIAFSIPIPWVHHFEEKKITELTVADTVKIKVSNKLPFLFKPLARLNEHLKSWLIDHMLCVRWSEHNFFLQGQLILFLDRSFEFRFEAGPFPVAYFATVGMAGWVLPNVAIIDGYGLNDYVVARLPIGPKIKRMMAHDRFAPHAYVASFLPNVRILEPKKVNIRRRPPEFELTREKIIAYEKFWDDKLVKRMNIPDSLAPFPTKPK